MARKKLKRSDLATLARQMRIIPLDEQERLLGMEKGFRDDPFTYDEFWNNYNSNLWQGGWVSGVEKNGLLLSFIGGETSSYVSTNLMRVDGETTRLYDGGTNGEVTFYTYSQFCEQLELGTWTGGFVEGYGYISINADVTYNGGSDSYLSRAKLFSGTPYLLGGCGNNGIDCSGLVTLATGSKDRWTTSSGKPPGNWNVVSADTSSATAFIQSLAVGDLLVWEGQHAAFYDGGETLFHAHGSTGSGEVGNTSDLKSYWLRCKGYHKVYRQTY